MTWDSNCSENTHTRAQAFPGAHTGFQGVFQEHVCLSSEGCCTVELKRGDPGTVACQVPLSMGFPRQEYCSGLPFPSPGDLPDLGIEPVSPALQVDSLLLSHQGFSKYIVY